MTNIFPLILSFIAGISTVIGSLFIFLKIKKVGEFIVFSLSFSLGIMTLISLFDLIFKYFIKLFFVLILKFLFVEIYIFLAIHNKLLVTYLSF